MVRLTFKDVEKELATIPYSSFRLQENSMASGYLVRSSSGSICYIGSNLTQVLLWGKIVKDWKALRDDSEDETFRYMADRVWYSSPKYDDAIKYLYLYEVEGDFLKSLKVQVMNFFNNPDSNSYDKPLSDKQASCALRIIGL